MTAPATPPTFAHRPWVTAGVALTAASMVVVAPVATPTLPDTYDFPDIQLTATDLIGDTASNLTNLVDYFAGATINLANGNVLGPNAAPFPILQQVIANQVDYLGQVLQNPGDIGTVFESMFDNLQAGLAAPFGMFGDNLATGGPLELAGVPILSRPDLFGVAQLLLGGDETLAGLLNFTASPVSGVLLGAVGPILGPLVALGNGVGEAFGGDPAALLGVPEDMLYAFLNGGQMLDLTDLLGAIGIPTSIEILGMDVGIQSAGIELGGILGGPGSIFNALTAAAGADLTPGIPGGLFGIELLGDGAGPLGSLLSVPNSIAAALGGGGIAGMSDGLLSTIATGVGLGDIADGLGDISAFLSSNVLDPLSDALMFLPNELAGLIDGALGADLGIDALAQMLVNIPQLLLTMML